MFRARGLSNIQKYIALTLCIMIGLLCLSFLASSKYSHALNDATYRIETCRNITRYVETLSENIIDIERSAESLRPISKSLIESDLHLLDLIEKGTDSSTIDIDYRYIVTLKHYHMQLQSEQISPSISHLLPSSNQNPSKLPSSSVDDSLYQIFSGAQRTSASSSIEKNHLNKLLTNIASVKTILGLMSLALFIVLVVISLWRNSRENYYTPSSIISSKSVKSSSHADRAAS